MDLNRKKFLQLLVLLGLAPRLMLGSVLQRTETTAQRNLLYGGYLRGLAHYDYALVWEHLSNGSVVALHREPNNKHDRYAIEVWFGRHKLGYLPRAENKTLSNMLDHSIDVEAEIRYVELEYGDEYNAVYVKVFGWLESKRVDVGVDLIGRID